MASLATVAELADRLQTTIASGQPTTAAQAALDQASAAIRTYTHQTISAVADDVKTFGFARSYGFNNYYFSTTLFLPQLPVTAVASVVLNGRTLVQDTDYSWDPPTGILQRLNGWWDSAALVNTVVVTYSHGYATVPDDVKDICMDLAGLGFQSKGDEPSEYTIGGYSERRPTPMLDDGQKLILDAYRPLALA